MSQPTAIRTLFDDYLRGWNARDAAAIARLFAADARLIGFDGSQISGQQEILGHLTQIFRDHPTGRYVAEVQDVRSIAPLVSALTAYAGMVPANGTDLKRELNTVFSMVATSQGTEWCIALLQATPAAWHGRDEDAEALLVRLRKILASGVASE